MTNSYRREEGGLEEAKARSQPSRESASLRTRTGGALQWGDGSGTGEKELGRQAFKKENRLDLVFETMGCREGQVRQLSGLWLEQLSGC